ncbi:MAG: PAS domain S-box protein [Burkholderiales bacterium]
MPFLVNTPSSAQAPSWLRRLFSSWRHQPTSEQQDFFATLGPLLSVLLFLAAIVLSFWYLRNEEIDREQESVQRDTEIAQQQIRLRLIENQEQLIRIARDLITRSVSPRDFLAQASNFSRDRPEMTQLSWLNQQRTVLASFSAAPFPKENSANNPSTPQEDQNNPSESAFQATKTTHRPVYSRYFFNDHGQSVIQIHIPLLDRQGFAGVVIAEYSLESLIRYFVPGEVSNRHAISLLEGEHKLIASTVTLYTDERPKATSITYNVPLTPANNGLFLRGVGYRTSVGLISNTLFWMVMTLSALTLWMLLGARRHMKRRLQMQAALVKEANFRRAMENSMLTGMRAMDMEGRITYVNPAFCAMTGFTEDELIGKSPPYPHWPPDHIEENIHILEQELQGRSPQNGIEVKVMRKDGSVFDARMYLSPLMAPKGQQTGWMTSMTNITEAKRIRDQLRAAHERFTTVLEGLDAAVSVVSVREGELLFANRFYRGLFDGQATGHSLLAGGVGPGSGLSTLANDRIASLEAGRPTQDPENAISGSREVQVEAIKKWFDVRTRYIQWTDGRLAQMLIATDITARLTAEAIAASQAEKAQVSSRLITMGEMASSVAHELNQPLTAIANYCNGMVSRVNANSITQDELITALQKTSRQAERAGQIIHRIRTFVKRSEPQQQAADVKTLVDEVMELAGIELRRRQVKLRSNVAEDLPLLWVDPILIEQVLLNLIKNAAEAIDSAQLPAHRRHVDLKVVRIHNEEEGDIVEFTITDMGPGIKNEAIGRLYEAFFSTKAEGMGIGLSLCRSLIESHRGRIKARNLYNETQVVGCCFSFSLPVQSKA